jgi:NAD(P)-dependent dehydrogenase (short-subunit alcohol dehydrogenase family)
MGDIDRRVALITGGSRGVGAATAQALAARGYDVALTYRNKARRANDVVAAIAALGGCALAIGGDMTQPADLDALFAALRTWTDRLDLLILNASGGLERAALAGDPQYPMRINRDAQVATLAGALPFLSAGSSVIFVTSHWAHLYGQVEQIPTYAPVAESKHAGEVALRARQQALDASGIRLIVVSGDLIEGTITPRLMARRERDHGGPWRGASDQLLTATAMGEAIARAATDPTLASGATIVVGAPLDSVPRL